ncbi:MAG TPA: outer membrane lipoprotein-sorting protein, partial [Anaeromyxobacter sp.]|nr:outer membrane lipoprotein-sorting protein [Anaeromyxobacter sp.]
MSSSFHLVLAAASLLALSGTPRPAAAAADEEVHSLLVRADAYRLASAAALVTTRVRVLKGGALDKERDYLVHVKPGRRSLVVSRSPVEKGQKVLMVGDDFWIVLPSTQRPIRITPAQKLLGDAAIGDVATLTWAEDYRGTLAGEEEVDGIACARLELTAARRGVTYARITLFLARADAHPVAAELYVASEKLAKRATFDMGSSEGRPLVVAMHLFDEIQVGRETRIDYLARQPRELPDEYY